MESNITVKTHGQIKKARSKAETLEVLYRGGLTALLICMMAFMICVSGLIMGYLREACLIGFIVSFTGIILSAVASSILLHLYMNAWEAELEMLKEYNKKEAR